MSYFEQIIFPPIPKVTVLFDINNRPMPPQLKNVDCWFVEVFDCHTEELKIQMMGSCPVCGASYIVRHKVKNVEIMKHALRENAPFYISYIKSHCPKCCPGNPVREEI